MATTRSSQGSTSSSHSSPDTWRRFAPNLSRPLLLVHGLADDNVFAAHTLQLSAALLAAGRPHAVLPLSGITHMASQESVAAGLAEAQMAFFAEHLQR